VIGHDPLVAAVRPDRDLDPVHHADGRVVLVRVLPPDLELPSARKIVRFSGFLPRNRLFDWWKMTWTVGSPRPRRVSASSRGIGSRVSGSGPNDARLVWDFAS
jgi:hypothetical protein